MLQLDQVMEILEESQQNLHVELDFCHLVMRQSINRAFSPQLMERLLEKQQHPMQQQREMERLSETQQQPWQQQSFEQQQKQRQQQQEQDRDLQQKQEEEQLRSSQTPQELLTLDDEGSTGLFGGFCECSAVVSNAALSAASSQTAAKYQKSKNMKRKLEQVKGLVKRRTVSKREELPRRKQIAGWLNTVFDKLLPVLMVANLVVIFCYLQYKGQETNKSLGLESQSWVHAELVFWVMDHFFCDVFLIELALRLYVERCAFFKSFFNIVDAVVVPAMAANLFLDGMGPNLAFVRTLRLLRIVCAFRVVRTLAHFQQLRVLLNTVAGSVVPFVYSMAIMFVFMLMLAILLTQTLHDFIVNDANDLETRQTVNRYFGDGVKSLWTVFELTFSGCWPAYARLLVEDVYWLYAPLFAVYVTTVIFAMTRIISALFLKETMSQASSDTESMVRERAKATSNMEKNLVALFATADTDGDGLLTEEEFAQVLENENIKLFLGMLGVDGSDAHDLYHTLAGDHVGGLPCDSFVYSVKRVKGEARAQDLIPVVNDCKQILRFCERTLDSLQSLELKFNDRYNGLRATAEGNAAVSKYMSL